MKKIIVSIFFIIFAQCAYPQYEKEEVPAKGGFKKENFFTLEISGLKIIFPGIWFLLKEIGIIQ